MRVRVERLAAALLLAAALPAWPAESLGTLFLTPEERARLDRLRRGESAEPAATGPRAPGQVTGFVRRSDGRNTVWVDGVPVPATAPANSPLLDPSKVRAYADRKQDDLHIERRPAR